MADDPPGRDDGITRLDQARAKRRAQRQATDAVGEDSLALEFAERHDGHFLYDHTQGAWLRWNDSRWCQDADEYVLDCVRVLIREHKVGKIRTARAVEAFARTDRRIARSHADWNIDPFLLGTPAGVVDLREGELMAADPSFMISMTTSVAPGPEGARCPLWTRFIEEVTCGDGPLQRYLQQRSGYWLTGSTHREDFDFLVGGGGNGKGTFLHTLHAIMGDYATTAPIAQFMVSQHDQHLCELARLAHVRLVIASEAEESRTWAVGKVKMLTGNTGKIAARHLNRDFFEYQPRFKLVFDGNSKPRISAVDEALARRLNLIPFRFQPKERDEGLKDRLKVEYPAILRWAIDGWLDLQRNGPIRPAVIAEATAEYLADEAIIAEWFAEHCERQLPPAAELLKDLFDSWKNWCVAHGGDPETSTRLRKRLERMPGIGSRRDYRGRWITGIGLKGP